ncbi:1176_t:CDS:2, partial [Scutellospora calospora]
MTPNNQRRYRKTANDDYKRNKRRNKGKNPTNADITETPTKIPENDVTKKSTTTNESEITKTNHQQTTRH